MSIIIYNFQFFISNLSQKNSISILIESNKKNIVINVVIKYYITFKLYWINLLKIEKLSVY